MTSLLVYNISSVCLANDEQSVNDEQSNNIIQSTSDASTQSEISPDAVITDIQFDGLKRTKEKYLKSELKHYTGKQLKDIDTHEIETELQKIGLFDSVSASIVPKQPDEAMIQITLIEKWAIIPIPLLSYVDEWMGGLIIQDVNAFGENDVFSIGAEGSKSRVKVMTSFSTPSVIGRHGLSFSASGAKDKIAVYDADKNKVLEYQSINYALSGKLNYRYTLRSSAVFGITYTFSENRAEEGYSDFDGSKQNLDLRLLSLNGKYNFEIADWNGWFYPKLKSPLMQNSA